MLCLCSATATHYTFDIETQLSFSFSSCARALFLLPSIHSINCKSLHLFARSHAYVSLSFPFPFSFTRARSFRVLRTQARHKKKGNLLFHLQSLGISSYLHSTYAYLMRIVHDLLYLSR